jgi:hypothetical protein
MAHGSPRHIREMSFLKKAEAFLHLWVINLRISKGINGEMGLLGLAVGVKGGALQFL